MAGVAYAGETVIAKAEVSVDGGAWRPRRITTLRFADAW